MLLKQSKKKPVNDVERNLFKQLSRQKLLLKPIFTI